MEKAQFGDIVTVVYDGVLNDGNIFDSSDDSGPLEFQIGSKSVLPGFEDAILDMTEGETRTIQLPHEEAYGAKNEELTQTVDRKNLSTDIDPKPGMVLGLTMEKDGTSHQVPATITQVTDDHITVDYNHPLAGQDLIFHVTLQSIKPAPPADNNA
ncbi:MAG: peptidylprolyl isomerase [Desulfobulbaceae bacterium]|nr:peptidylprolyl isomerase [Desulfobulbaceae bacterium]